MRISIIGLRRLASHGIMSTKAAALMSANVTMKVEENQSSTRPRSSTISSAPRKVATNTKPTTSNPPASKSRRLCFSTAAAASRNQCDRAHADRTVDEKAPVPGIVIRQIAAERRPDDRRHHHGNTEQRKALPALRRRERIGENRLRDRHHAAAAEALQDAEEQERLQAPGKSAQHRARGEERETDQEEALAAEQASEKAAGRQGNRVRDKIRGDDP